MYNTLYVHCMLLTVPWRLVSLLLNLFCYIQNGQVRIKIQNWNGNYFSKLYLSVPRVPWEWSMSILYFLCCRNMTFQSRSCAPSNCSEREESAGRKWKDRLMWRHTIRQLLTHAMLNAPPPCLPACLTSALLMSSSGLDQELCLVSVL